MAFVVAERHSIGLQVEQLEHMQLVVVEESVEVAAVAAAVGPSVQVSEAYVV